ncbi:MAG: SRPBCC family protein [Actinomycetota bacterium]|nr:SRPBCC family protein [Actinomycetota bacterium]
MRRGSVRRELVLRVPAARAWEAVTRAELLHLWFPGLTASPVDGDQRTVTLGSGIAFTETILTNDPIQRRFQYRITGGVFQEHLATIDVHDLDGGSCLVVYASDAAPGAMALILGGATLGALEELRRQLEGGAGPLVDALAPPTEGAVA